MPRDFSHRFYLVFELRTRRSRSPYFFTKKPFNCASTCDITIYQILALGEFRTMRVRSETRFLLVSAFLLTSKLNSCKTLKGLIFLILRSENAIQEEKYE